MSFTGIIKFFFRRILELVVIGLLITFIPYLPPDAKFSTPYKVAPFRPLEGKLSLNNKLDDVEIWHKGDLLGPEAFADLNGELYTSVHGGDIVKLVGNHITPVVKFGKPCKGLYQEDICGRPLGFVFDKQGALIAADAYYGIFKVDVKTGKKDKLISVGDVIDGVKVKVPNSVAVTNNGDIYWTDSSTEFSLNDGVFDILADGSGRLIHYDPKTKRNTVLIKDLHFANGVVLSDDEEFILVSETLRSRVHRYFLKGPKKGTHDIFIDGLPGLTDNLKSDGKSGFFVPLVMANDAEHPSFPKIFGPFPKLRKFMARVLGLVESGFKLIDRMYPNEFSQRAIHMIGHFGSVRFVDHARVTVLHLSKTGEILDSLHTTNGKIAGISEVHIFGDTLLLGSPFNDYIARISLKKIGWEHLRHTTTPKPTTTTPKPTTTTPKSTTTTPKPTTTTPKPTTTTPKPTTTTPKPTTTTPKPTTTTPKPSTTTPKPTTTTPKPTTTASKTSQKPGSTTNPPKPSPTPASPQAKAVPKQNQAPSSEQNKDQPKTGGKGK